MFALVSPDKIQLPAGAVVRLPATWQDYQKLCQQRGDGSIPRLKYRTGEVLLMSPLPEYGRDAHLIANVITTLLDYTGREYYASHYSGNLYPSHSHFATSRAVALGNTDPQRSGKA